VRRREKGDLLSSGESQAGTRAGDDYGLCGELGVNRWWSDEELGVEKVEDGL